MLLVTCSARKRLLMYFSTVLAMENEVRVYLGVHLISIVWVIWIHPSFLQLLII